MKRFFTSDTHFSDQRVLVLSRRPFNSVEHMDDEMIANWNSVVSADDVVFHLGDFGNYDISHSLNGRIFLLYGNYERKNPPEQQYNFNTIWTSNNKLIPFEEGTVALIHEPSHRIPFMFNLFGHVHKLSMIKSFGLNVGVDCHNYAPISDETVSFYKNAIENHYDYEVFI